VQVVVVDHPLVAHKLTFLRDKSTDTPTFTRLVDELVTLLAYEATRDIRVVPVAVQTPVSPADGVHLAEPKPVLIPILRAGLGMLAGMQHLLPSATVGFLGMSRDEESLEITTYADRMPADLTGTQVYLLDPMLATAGTICAAVDHVANLGAAELTMICLLASPEGIARLEAHAADNDVRIRVVTGSIDLCLNDRAYIVPGLGDAGDRLYGVV